MAVSRSTIGFFGTGLSDRAKREQDIRRKMLARVDVLGNYFKAFPGAAPGGTGRTGLEPGDLTGFLKQQENQSEYMRLLKALRS